MSHRGPDDRGLWLDDRVALGQLRLSIVDLSPLGHQPMVSQSGRYVIAFNGEIYNHAALREELNAEGVRMRGHSDTEVLLELIERVGLEEALQRSIGMFALAVVDRQRRLLHLARDRFGEKPLYLGFAGGDLVFASELKALMANPSLSRDVDPQAVLDVIRTGFVHAPRSILRDVRQLPPGTIQTRAIAKGAPLLSERQYWSAAARLAQTEASGFRGSFEDAVSAVSETLKDAIRLQMQADVPLGAFLSGGIDSSLVVALMQSQANRPVRTYSIGFRDERLNEAAHARAVASHLGTVHTEWYVESDEVLQLVPSLPSHYDEPLADASQLPTLILAKLTRRDVTVALSGDGADEIFGGYPKYALGHRLMAFRGRRAVGWGAQWIQRSVVRHLQTALPPTWSSRIAWHRAEAVAEVYGAPSASALADSLSTLSRSPVRYLSPTLRQMLGPLQAHEQDESFPLDLEYRRLAMLRDAQQYLPGDILVKVDRATMAASLESRAPFLDHRVFELAATLPSEHLFDHGGGKRVLRAALARLVPNDLIDRPKAGFVPPLGTWLRTSLRDWAAGLLASPAASKVIDPHATSRLFALHCEGRFDLSARLWPLLTLAAWSEHWLSKESA